MTWGQTGAICLTIYLMAWWAADRIVDAIKAGRGWFTYEDAENLKSRLSSIESLLSMIQYQTHVEQPDRGEPDWLKSIREAVEVNEARKADGDDAAV